MKKVWVLEIWQTPEEVKRSFTEVLELLEELDGVDVEKAHAYAEAQIANPEGRWLGWEGKCNYRQFCDVAREALMRDKHNHKNSTFRVVEAEMPDDEHIWANNYNVVKENAGVLRYLYATS